MISGVDVRVRLSHLGKQLTSGVDAGVLSGAHTWAAGLYL